MEDYENRITFLKQCRGGAPTSLICDSLTTIILLYRNNIEKRSVVPSMSTVISFFRLNSFLSFVTRREVEDQQPAFNQIARHVVVPFQKIGYARGIYRQDRVRG